MFNGPTTINYRAGFGRSMQFNRFPFLQTSIESLLGILSHLVDAELEELKVLQTTILLVTTNHALSNVSLSQVSLHSCECSFKCFLYYSVCCPLVFSFCQALGICLRLHNSKTGAVVNTAAAAIRQCTGTVFDMIAKTESPFLPEDFQGA